MKTENREFFIDCDGCRCHAKLDFPKTEKEKLPLLVIIHGLTGNMEERHIIATAETANKAGYAALRVEMFGHGMSDGAFCDHTVLLWMTQAMRIIQYAKNLDFVSDIYLTGHSQGGLTAILTAGIMGDYIKAMIPMSPATAIKDFAFSGQFIRTEYDTENLPDRLPIRDDFYVKGDYLRAARILPIEECVAAYKKPVLIIHGTKDESIPFSYGEKLAEQYKNAKLVAVPDDTHCYDLHLDIAMDALRAFLMEYRGKN